MAIKRLFDEEGVPARIIGASSVEAAMNQLKKNDRYRAVLVQWEEADLLALELTCAVKERGRPAVVAFQKEWDRDDVRRALQLGVDSLLYDPFSIDELFADLKALTEEGVSKTRAQLLGEGGEVLLTPDPSLWTQQDDDWRGRMMALADQMQRPWSEGVAEKAGDLESSLLRAQDDHDAIDPGLARAVMAVLDQGRDRLPAVAREHQVDPRTLQRVTEAVEEFAEFNGGPARIPLLMNEVMSKIEGQGTDSGKLMVLKRVARVVLRTGGRSGRRKDALNESLRRMLGVPMPVLDLITPDERVDLCGRVLFAESEDEALEHCRLVVLANMLEHVDSVNPTGNHLQALAALFGLKARIEGIEPESLLRRLAMLNPLPVLYDVDLLDLEPFRERIPEPPQSTLDKALAGVLDGLLEAAEPHGDLDQRRLSALLAAIKAESAVLIGRPTWRTLHAALQGARQAPPPVDRMLERLTFLVGARTQSARARLLAALGDLIDVGRNALDAARFAEFCRAASAEALGRDVIEEYAAETPAEFTPDRARRPGAAAEQALVDGAIDELRRIGVDPAEIRDNLPPSPRIATRLSAEEMTRMRVMAASLWERALPEQKALIERALAGGQLRAPEFAAMEAMLGEGETVEMLRAHSAAEETEPDRPLVEHFERGLTGPMPPIKPRADDADPAARRREDELLAARAEAGWTARPEARPAADDLIAARAGDAAPRVPLWSRRETGASEAVGEDPLFGAPPPPPPGAIPVDLAAVDRQIARGDLDAAAAELRDVRDGTPNLPDALNRVALHLYVAGRRTAAGALWERAVRLGPDQINILFNLARLRVEMGQPAEARPLLRRVLTSRPHLTPGRMLFARVRDEMRAGVR